MSNANWAFGSILTSPAGVIAEIDEIGVFAPRAETIDVTTHGSASGYREFIGGLRDGGELTLKGNFYPGNAPQIAMKTYLDDGEVRAFTVTMPAAMGATITLDGIVTGLDIGPFPVDGKVVFGGTIKITGKPLVNVAASNNLSAMAGIEETGAAALDFVPNFAAGIYVYSTALINTASTWVKVTVTFAAGIGTVECLGVTQSLVSTVQSGAILIGAADSTTVVTITIKETNKVAKVYTIHVPRP